MKRVRARLVGSVTAAAVALAGAIGASALTTGSAHAAATTQPTTETARSLYTNNWTDTTGIWMAPQLAQTDTNTSYGPRLAELHYSPNGTASGGSAVNQITDYTGFFRDETHGVRYDQVHNFTGATGYLDSGGILRSDYGAYAGQTPPVTVGRDYATVPGQHFTVVTYRLKNTTASPVTMNVLDQLHVNNTGAATGKTVRAAYDATRDAETVDMSASGQYHLVLGSFGASTGHQVGDDANADTASPTVAPWYAFDATGTLPGNASVTAADVSVALSKRVTVPANSQVSTSFYLAIAATAADALTAADTARGASDTSWQQNTSTAYGNWLAAGKRVSTTFADGGLSTAYDRALVVAKQTQNPVLGTWPAATDPIAYGYKTWIRDSAVTALSMDAAGHHAEADKYFRWLAGIQSADGSFGTTYDEWTGQFINFVQPENDSIGLFVVGALRHYTATGDASFLAAMWPAVQKAANFIGTAPGATASARRTTRSGRRTSSTTPSPRRPTWRGCGPRSSSRRTRGAPPWRTPGRAPPPRSPARSTATRWPARPACGTPRAAATTTARSTPTTPPASTRSTPPPTCCWCSASSTPRAAGPPRTSPGSPPP